jgi:hypothetical protein
MLSVGLLLLLFFIDNPEAPLVRSAAPDVEISENVIVAGRSVMVAASEVGVVMRLVVADCSCSAMVMDCCHASVGSHQLLPELTRRCSPPFLKS